MWTLRDTSKLSPAQEVAEKAVLSGRIGSPEESHRHSSSEMWVSPVKTPFSEAGNDLVLGPLSCSSVHCIPWILASWSGSSPFPVTILGCIWIEHWRMFKYDCVVHLGPCLQPCHKNKMSQVGVSPSVWAPEWKGVRELISSNTA